MLIVSTKTSIGDTLSSRKNVPKPIIIDNYNKYMSGCDRADQLVGYHGHQNRKSTPPARKVQDLFLLPGGSISKVHEKV